VSTLEEPQTWWAHQKNLRHDHRKWADQKKLKASRSLNPSLEQWQHDEHIHYRINLTIEVHRRWTTWWTQNAKQTSKQSAMWWAKKWT